MKKSLLLTLAFSSAFLYASETMYTSSVKNLFESSDSTSSKGRLLPTSKVKILETKGDNIKIELEGFMKDGVDSAVYFSEGKRILIAGLSKSSNFDFKTISTSKDEEGVEWKKVTFTAFTKNNNLTEDLDALYAQAQTVFANNCAMCHPAHPASEFTANQWPSIVKSMINRTAMTKDENYLVTQYLQKHAKDMGKGESK
jgi:trimethylamine-N-oxide reductase cytochrome c-type subunit TorC